MIKKEISYSSEQIICLKNKWLFKNAMEMNHYAFKKYVLWHLKRQQTLFYFLQEPKSFIIFILKVFWLILFLHIYKICSTKDIIGQMYNFKRLKYFKCFFLNGNILSGYFFFLLRHLNHNRASSGIEKYPLEFFIISRGSYSLSAYLWLKYVRYLT